MIDLFDDLSLYIHIPFCVRKCLYCDFPSYGGMENYYDDYVKRICSEIEKAGEVCSKYKINTVFIGGGTPTVLKSGSLEKIMKTVFDNYNVVKDAEITCEANPGTLDMAKLRDMRAMGINRLSMGLQARQNDILKLLGRIHTAEDFEREFLFARRAGFENISCDIMFSLPRQTVEDWRETVSWVVSLNPEHISAYSLIIEEGTPFKDMYDNGKITVPDDETDRKMYHMAVDMLEEKGYKRYEISNFAKAGFESRHNSVYWRTGEYMGFGLGAHSYFNGRRFHNTYNLEEYIRSGQFKKYDVELLSENDKMAEFMFMGLRMSEGVSVSEFKRRFGMNIDEIYGKELKEIISEGLAFERDNRVILTDYGFDVSNYVFEKFII